MPGGDYSSGLAEADRYLLKQKQYDPGRADRQQPRRADYGLPQLGGRPPAGSHSSLIQKHRGLVPPLSFARRDAASMNREHTVMKKLGSLVCAGIALGAAVSVVSAGASAADAYIVHGIPGDDLGLDPHLPVDISVDGACAFPGVRLGEVLGPTPLEAGTYEVGISLADSANPCGGALAVTDTVGISVAETAVLVANLDVNGAPRLSKYTTKTAPIDADEARVTAYHTAAAPSVDLRVKPDGGGEVVAVISGLENGEQTFPAEVPAGAYLIRISPSPERGTGFLDAVAEIPVDLVGGTAYALFAIGSLENGTFDVVPLVIEPQS